MNNKNIRYELHELSGAGFVIWDNNKCGPISGMYAMSEASARAICDAFNKKEKERLDRQALLARGAA